MNALEVLLPGIAARDAAAAVAAIGAVLVVFLVWRALIDYDPLPERLRALEQRRTELRGAMAVRARRARRMGREEQQDLLTRLKKRMRGNRTAGDLAIQFRLARAGIRGRDAIGTYRLARYALPGVFALVTALVVHTVPGFHVGAWNPLAVLAGAAVGWKFPDFYLGHLATKRTDAVRKTLPDGFDLMVICAEAGLSLDASLDRVARELGQSAPELSDELAVTALELSFLPDRNKALSGLSDRVDLPGIRALVNTFMQTERYGTPLAQALRVLAHELREERMLKAEEKAARLPALLTIPMVVFILPPLFVVLIGPAILKAMDSFAKLNPG